MKSSSIALIRALLSTRLSAALKAANTPDQQDEKIVVNDIAEYSDALVDLMRSGGSSKTSPTDKAATAALDLISQNTRELAELDHQFEQGAGKGSRTHQLIRRLRGLAESTLPELNEVPA